MQQQSQCNRWTRPPGYIELGAARGQSRSPIATGLCRNQGLHQGSRQPPLGAWYPPKTGTIHMQLLHSITFPTKAPHPSTLIRNHDAIRDPFAISAQSMNKTAGVYRTRNGRWAVSFTDCVRIAPVSQNPTAINCQFQTWNPVKFISRSPQKNRNPSTQEAIQIIHCSHNKT